MLKTEGVNHVIAQSVNHVSLDIPAARNLTVSTFPVEWNAPQRECRGRCPHRPAQVGFHPRPVEWKMLIYPVPFNVQGGCVRVRVDVGIDPYIETIRASHSSCRVVAWGCGRLVAAPTEGGGLRAIHRGWAAAGYKLVVCAIAVVDEGSRYALDNCNCLMYNSQCASNVVQQRC